MRIVLVHDGEPQELAEIREALVARGDELHDATFAAALAGVSAELIIALVQVAQIPKLAASAPGIEIITIGAHLDRLPAEVLANLDPPIDTARLLELVDEVASIVGDERTREPLDLVTWETLFAGDSPAIRNLLRRVRLVARSDEPVWIFSQDGSGRAVVARAIHDRSARRNQPFVACNASALSDDELSVRLFAGSEAAIHKAARGTLFIEQIASAGSRTQRELVQFLDRKRADAQTSARLIVGVQPTLDVQQAFSQDLYYRLKVLELEIPPLKDRTADLEHIVARMLDALAASSPRKPTITAEAMRALERYSFPGNLLELAHALIHAVVLAHGSAIEPQHLPASMRQEKRSEALADSAQTDMQSLDSVAKQFEREYLIRVLRSVGGSRVKAAEILGLSRKGLWGKLKAHGISNDDISEPDEDTTGTLLEGPWKPRRS